MPLVHGDIVWILAVDPNGFNKKLRPWVILNISKQANSIDRIAVAAITTTIPNPLTSNYVELPWERLGKVKTGLRKRSAVVCDWVRAFDSIHIARRSGYVPPAKLN